MPNGGSDCCGTCWFNRANGGEAGRPNHEIPSYCEIRQLDIPNPMYTYCANHPHHRPQRDPIPIGPVTVHKGELVEREPGRHEMREWRERWQPSPDTETIRSHLLSLLEDPATGSDEFYLFFTKPVVWVVLDQLIEFGEQRAIPILERVSEEMAASGEDASELRRAVDQIRG
ncbi:MAG: hypothetical protein F4020_03955 [Gammaproteobacteria bacterium]|nr:hypothetical protein [Gammaproteobacteria bacterium]MYK68723.1 hypothetical protein [Gammaproteobacteria bacterium]